MSCMSVNLPVTGSKIAVLCQPWNGSYCRLPPNTMIRPSGSATIPLQNMSQPIACVVIVFVLRSHTPAWKLVFAGTLPEPDTTRIFPLCIRLTCTGLMGIVVGNVCHCPFVLACPYALAAKKAKSNAKTAIRAEGAVCFERCLCVGRRAEKQRLGRSGAEYRIRTLLVYVFTARF